MELKTTDLTWSPYIYPRGGKSDKTISAYIEAAKFGAHFPSHKGSEGTILVKSPVVFAEEYFKET